MAAIPNFVVKNLDLNAAAIAESQAVRNLLPPEPWRAAVAAKSLDVSAWIRTRLLSGRPHSPGVTINARKLGHGIRPVPIVGIAERVAYRALTTLVLTNQEIPKRDAEEYKAFVLAPIKYAYRDMRPGRVRFNQSTLSYVIESDIAAFYQYIDHEILRQELHMQTGKIDATNHLLDLLADIVGKRFGVPQLLDASDSLSEMYIRILERALIRRGIPLWRFNDDFRIGCTDYQDALNKIELLADTARDLGLIISDHKTFPYRFTKYVSTYTNVDIDQTSAEFDPQDVETTVTEYADRDEAESYDAAVSTFRRTNGFRVGRDRIDLKAVKKDDLRSLRRAFNYFTKSGDDFALKYTVRLFRFVPALTPSIIRYLIRIAAEQELKEEVQQILLHLSEKSVNQWQIVWLTYACRETDLASTSENAAAWIRKLTERHNHEAVKAEASLTLAKSSLITFTELDESLQNSPDSLAPWYVLGMRALVDTEDAPQESQIEAVKKSSPLFSSLLDYDGSATNP